MAVWLENFERLLRQKEALVLHGNIRDSAFLTEDGTVIRGLTELLRTIAKRQEFSCVRFWGMMPKMDNPEEELPLWHLEKVEQLDGSRPQYLKINSENKQLQLLNRWHQEEIRKTTDKTLFVIFHIDKLTPFNQSCSYGHETGLLVTMVQKIIGNLAGNNRLIMVALRDTMVPLEYYTNAPRVALLEIPLPGREERRAYLARQLGNALLKQDSLEVLANITDGLYLRDMENIVRSAREEITEQQLIPSQLRKLVNRYRIGSEKDPWSALPLEGAPKGLIDCAEAWFQERVVGQDHAVLEVVRAIKKARAGISGLVSGQATKPRGVFFFAGPTGVGKTLLAKKLAEFLFDNESFTRFDMSEFKEEHTVSKLIGAPPGYVGYERGGELTNRVRNKPFSIVLFDEIEKAHPKILDIFLQILDDGRLTDSRGQTVFFTESVIIFTSNIGTRSMDSQGRPLAEKGELEQIIAKGKGGKYPNIDGEVREHFIGCVREFFQNEISRPELLNRLGSQIIAFNFISNDAAVDQIIRDKLKDIAVNFREKFSKRGYSLCFDNDEVKRYLKCKYGDQVSRFGGRGLLGAIDNEIGHLLADHLLFAESHQVSEMPLKISVKRIGSESEEKETLVCKHVATV